MRVIASLKKVRDGRKELVINHTRAKNKPAELIRRMILVKSVRVFSWLRIG